MPPSASVSTAQSVVKNVAKSAAKGAEEGVASVAKSIAVANGAEEGVKELGFLLGQKQVFLPRHVLTFIRPKEGQPPNLATFKVPLTFNKFDFRDYLWNCYNVEVSSVRSFINQQRPKQRSFGGSGGKWYRPRSIKMMIADLKQPFVWPEPPADKDKEAWDNKLFTTVEKNHEEQSKKQQELARGRPKLRSRGQAGPTRAQLAKSAKLLAWGLARWESQAAVTKKMEAASAAHTAETIKAAKVAEAMKAAKVAEEAEAAETARTSDS